MGSVSHRPDLDADLHANLTVRGEDREALEKLCRYLLRPAVAQDRLRLRGSPAFGVVAWRRSGHAPTSSL